jgi:hypothetical protein
LERELAWIFNRLGMASINFEARAYDRACGGRFSSPQVTRDQDQPPFQHASTEEKGLHVGRQFELLQTGRFVRKNAQHQSVPRGIAPYLNPKRQTSVIDPESLQAFRHTLLGNGDDWQELLANGRVVIVPESFGS